MFAAEPPTAGWLAAALSCCDAWCVSQVAAAQPYAQWLQQTTTLPKAAPLPAAKLSAEDLMALQARA